MRPPPKIRPPAARMRRTEAYGELPRSVTKRLRTSALPEHFDRCLPVTDKRKSAWQKRPIRCKGGPLKSVCRELPRAALAAAGGAMYRLRMNRCVQAWQISFGANSDANQMLTECVARPKARCFSETCDGRYRELFHAGAVRPRGCEDA